MKMKMEKIKKILQIKKMKNNKKRINNFIFKITYFENKYVNNKRWLINNN